MGGSHQLTCRAASADWLFRTRSLAVAHSECPHSHVSRPLALAWAQAALQSSSSVSTKQRHGPCSHFIRLSDCIRLTCPRAIVVARICGMFPSMLGALGFPSHRKRQRVAPKQYGNPCSLSYLWLVQNDLCRIQGKRHFAPNDLIRSHLLTLDVVIISRCVGSAAVHACWCGQIRRENAQDSFSSLAHARDSGR